MLQEEIAKRGLTLAALCLALEWLYPEPTEYERAETDRVIQYMKHFPGAALIFVQLPGKDRTNLAERQKNALSNINAAARLAGDHGITCAYHPNSPAGSIFRTEEDYEVLLNGINTAHCGYAPDSGHIAKGGMDVVEIFKTYRSLIRHVHFKDIADGAWTAMGNGVIDHPAIGHVAGDGL